MYVSNLSLTELDIYTKLNEKQVKGVFEPDEGAFICESIRVIERAIEAGYELLSFLWKREKKTKPDM